MPEPPERRPAHLQLLAISWNFGWPVAAGVMVGYWLDQKTGTSPLLTLTLGLGAMSAAIWRLIRLGKLEAAERRHDEQRQRSGQEDRIGKPPPSDVEDPGRQEDEQDRDDGDWSR